MVPSLVGFVEGHLPHLHCDPMGAAGLPETRRTETRNWQLEKAGRAPEVAHHRDKGLFTTNVYNCLVKQLSVN